MAITDRAPPRAGAIHSWRFGAWRRGHALPGLGLAALLLAGCAVLPEPQALRLSLPETYASHTPAPRLEEADRMWWRDFRDPVLDALVTRALAGNLGLAQARARLVAAEAEARAAGAGAVSGDLTLALEAESPGADARRTGLGALFDPGAGMRRAGAAARAEAARAEAAEARRQIAAQVALAYIDLRFAEAAQAASRRDLTSRRRTLSDVTTQRDAGVATELDVLRARTLVAETEAELPRFTADIARQRNRIATLIGQPAGAAGVDLRATARQPRPAVAARPGVPADLLRSRPDIARAERAYAAALADLGAARAARWPSLSLSGQIRVPLVGGAVATETLAAGLALPVFTQGRLAASADAAEGRAEAALVAWRAAVLGALEEVETALSAQGAAQASARGAARVVALNEEALALSRRQLETGGAITVLDLLDRERALAAARIAQVRAERDRAASHVTLRSALGGGDPAAVADEDS